MRQLGQRHHWSECTRDAKRDHLDSDAEAVSNFGAAAARDRVGGRPCVSLVLGDRAAVEHSTPCGGESCTAVAHSATRRVARKRINVFRPLHTPRLTKARAEEREKNIGWIKRLFTAWRVSHTPNVPNVEPSGGKRGKTTPRKEGENLPEEEEPVQIRHKARPCERRAR